MISIDNEENQYLSRDIKVHEDDTEREGRLTITNKRFLIDIKKSSFSPFGKQEWASVLDMEINDTIELSLDKRKKCVLVTGDGKIIKICAGDISADKLLKEIRRNIDIANNLSKNNSFSSKRIIYGLKRKRGIK